MLKHPVLKSSTCKYPSVSATATKPPPTAKCRTELHKGARLRNGYSQERPSFPLDGVATATTRPCASCPEVALSSLTTLTFQAPHCIVSASRAVSAEGGTDVEATAGAADRSSTGTGTTRRFLFAGGGAALAAIADEGALAVAGALRGAGAPLATAACTGMAGAAGSGAAEGALIALRASGTGAGAAGGVTAARGFMTCCTSAAGVCATGRGAGLTGAIAVSGFAGMAAGGFEGAAAFVATVELRAFACFAKAAACDLLSPFCLATSFGAIADPRLRRSSRTRTLRK